MPRAEGTSEHVVGPTLAWGRGRAPLQKWSLHSELEGESEKLKQLVKVHRYNQNLKLNLISEPMFILYIILYFTYFTRRKKNV